MSFKCTLNINPTKNSKKGEIFFNKLASIKKLSLSILAKTLKEVNEISKYFKTTNSANKNNNAGKSYAHVSKLVSNAREVLKIKKVFPNLQAKKIKNIQKIINSNSKSSMVIAKPNQNST